MWERKLDASGSPPLADLYIRDNIIDIGRDPVPADAVDPLNKDRHISPFSGADIKIDTPLLGSDFLRLPSTLDYTGQTGADFIAFQQLDTLNELRRRTKSRVYVEVMNRGPADATNVVVRAFYASKPSGYPNLPQDFWSKFPDADPDMSDWKKIRDKVSLGTLPPAQPKGAMWEFETPLDTHDPVGILAVATCQEDPVAKTDFDPAHLATTDKRAALREVSASAPRKSSPPSRSRWAWRAVLLKGKQASATLVLPTGLPLRLPFFNARFQRARGAARALHPTAWKSAPDGGAPPPGEVDPIATRSHVHALCCARAQLSP